MAVAAKRPQSPHAGELIALYGDRVTRYHRHDPAHPPARWPGRDTTQGKYAERSCGRVLRGVAGTVPGSGSALPGQPPTRHVTNFPAVPSPRRDPAPCRYIVAM